MPFLWDTGFDVHDLDYAPAAADLLIVDHYGLDEGFEAAARAWATYITVIDDLADRPHDCDLLLDQTYGRAAQAYKALVPDHCKILAGSDLCPSSSRVFRGTRAVSCAPHVW